MKGPMFFKSALKNVGNKYSEQNPSAAFQQTDGDLKEWLVSNKGFDPKSADQQIEDKSYSTSDKDFLAWYNKKGKTQGLAAERVDAPVEGSAMEYKSALKNRETVNGELVKHKHKDGSVHSYDKPKKDKMGNVVKHSTDETGKITKK